MKEIKLLMEHIEDEVCDARTYAELAVEYQSTDPETAELFYKLSGEEMSHMYALHKNVVRLIDAHRRGEGRAACGHDGGVRVPAQANDREGGEGWDCAGDV